MDANLQQRREGEPRIRLSIVSIREVKAVSTLKKTITVANSSKGKNNYVVQITSTPSCTCSDYHKNKSKVLCQHIIFVVTVALGGMDLVETLRTRYIGDDALKALLRKQIPAKYLQKNKKKTKKQFGEILMTSGEYNNVQTTLLHKKTTKSTKCTKCKITITRCTNCFVVTVPFNSGKAAPQNFYFCAEPACILSVPPSWTNIRLPTRFRAPDEITDEEREVIQLNCNLVLDL